jgi:hypothetical protein
MFYYTHHRHTDVCRNVHVDVPPCHAADLIPFDTQHQQTDGPQQILVDLHYEDSSIKNNKISGKITNTTLHEDLSFENLYTKHGKKS